MNLAIGPVPSSKNQASISTYSVIMNEEEEEEFADLVSNYFPN